MGRRRIVWAGVGVAVLGLLAAGANQFATAASGVGSGNVSVSWSLPGTPAAGVTDITFPMTVNPATKHVDGTYFAQQFNFTHAADVGYTGLQPRPDSNGHERLHAAFSSFIAGTTSSDSNCHSGADGGPGVSCAADFDGGYGHRYAMKVERTGPDTWTGTATDTVTGIATHVGTYTLPAGSGNLKGSQVGFVEYYLGAATCTAMPKVDVQFGNPTSTTGGLTGTVRAEYEYSGDCLGKAAYSAVNDAAGAHVQRGFVAEAGPVTAGPASPTTTAGHPGTLVNGAGRCLDDPAGNTTAGTRLIAYPCHGGPNQQWTLTAAHTLVSAGKCVDAYAGGRTPGTKVILWPCHGLGNQQWTLQGDGTVRGVQSGLCLAPTSGRDMGLATCTAAADQRWTRR